MKLLMSAYFPLTAQLSCMQLFSCLQEGICSVCSYIGHGFLLLFKILIPLKLWTSFCLLLFSLTGIANILFIKVICCTESGV